VTLVETSLLTLDIVVIGAIATGIGT